MEKNKKELTPKQQQQRKKLLVYPLMFAICGAIIYFIFAPSSTEKKRPDLVDGLNVDVPMPTDENMIGDKKTAYENEQQRKQQEEKMRTLQEYAFSLTGQDSVQKSSDDFDLKIEEPGNPELTVPSSGHSNIELSNEAYRNMNKELSSFYEPDKDNQEKKRLEAKIEELTDQLNNQGTGQPDPVDMMEKSYKLAAKYLNPAPQPQPEKKDADPGPKSASGDITNVSVSGVTENVVSGLSQNISDSAFMAEYTKSHNFTFHTAVGTDPVTERNTIRASIYQDQTLEFGNNEDQKVRFRLLEDIQAGTTIIPKNSLLAGDATLEKGRVNATISHLEYNGKIFPVKLTIYDLNGQEGICAAGSAETDALKDAAGSVAAGMGTSVTITKNAGQQLATDATKGIIQAGSQYLSKKVRSVKVHLKADHEVLLLTTKL